MGRSFARLQPEHVPEFGKPFHHKASDSYFTMVARDGKYYQRRWQIGFDGKETNVDEKQVDFVVGSGNHSLTYLHLTSRGALQVLPLSWYSENGGYWDMSPGYDQPDFPGSVRPVHYECMFCHNAYPKIPEALEHAANAEMTFLDPVPEGIDCQRCHGPGQRHVALASAGAAPEQIRAAIINPKRLAPDRELEVCMQCHLETTSLDLPHSIRRFDRAPFSYVPGQPLGDFSVEFDRPGGMKDRFEIAHGAYRLRQSQCYIQSAGKLRCTTCHDPHNIPRGPAAAAHYNAVCEQCHAATLRTDGRRPTCCRSRLRRLPHAEAQNRRRGACGHDRSFDSAAKAGGRSSGAEGGDQRDRRQIDIAARWCLTIRRRSPILRRTRCTLRPPKFATGGISRRVCRGWRTCWSDTIPRKPVSMRNWPRAMARRAIGRRQFRISRRRRAASRLRSASGPARQRVHGKPAVPAGRSDAAARHCAGS